MVEASPPASGSTGLRTTKIADSGHRHSGALPGDLSQRRSPLHPAVIFLPHLSLCFVPSSPQICSVLHIFCAEIQSSVLEAAKHESGLCNELHLLLFPHPPLEYFGKAMSESLESLGSANPSFAFWDEGMCGGFQTHSLHALVVQVSM